MKINILKPIIGVGNTEIIHPLFYKQFLKYYKLLKKNKNDFSYLVLSGLFLYLVLESYITWIIRWLLDHVNRRKNRKLIRIWKNHYESSANLNKKVQFFAYVFLAEKNNTEIKQIESFVRRLGEIRNKIVHGHEFSIINWSDGKIQRTKFAKLLTFKEIVNCYNDFKNCMELISVLIKRIDVEELTSGIPDKKWAFKYLTFTL